MTETEDKRLTQPVEPSIENAIVPSWKPLWWVLGTLVMLIGLGELILDFGMEFLEFLFDIFEPIYLVVVEAPEEILEDRIEDWLKEHYPNDASLYSEMITAIGLTPVKILVGIMLLKGLWSYSKQHFIPKIVRWGRSHYLSVRLAINLLSWPYKILAGIVILGILVIII